jgi:uncharacterized NAD(P)/FAD-binding protein YdhS
MKKIGIIGGGFAGTMCAIQLIKQTTTPIELHIVSDKETFNKGIAYTPYSDKQLLNVVTGKMSAYPENPAHFLNWVMKLPEYRFYETHLIDNSFLPRSLYGAYLEEQWDEISTLASEKKCLVITHFAHVTLLEKVEQEITVHLDNLEVIHCQDCIIASGNHIPRNPTIPNKESYDDANYFQNPWKIEAVSNVNSTLPVLIIGNGLTMVDTVLGLIEQGFKGTIYSISPNGFNMLPHRHNGLTYTKLTSELTPNLPLLELVRLVNKHIKAVRKIGISAEPIIDSLRPHTQEIWKGLSAGEKKIFMSRLRHLWGVARHRIPLHTHERIQQLRLTGKLHIEAGKIKNLRKTEEGFVLEYREAKTHLDNTLRVGRVINCTGPETDLSLLPKHYLKTCLEKGIIEQDELKLGIRTNVETFQLIDQSGATHEHLFSLGSNLKGELWESTAVNELRNQAYTLAKQLV